jgi:uncharacterized protein (DUF433 family)
MQYGRELRWWSSAGAIHLLLESRGFLAICCKQHEALAHGWRDSVATTIEYVEEREGEYSASRTRVPVGVVLAAWKRGYTPERIVEQFPSLSLADVYGVITYYLDHQREMEAHFTRLGDEEENARQTARAADPDFYADLQQRIDAVRRASSEDPGQ